MEVKEYTNLLHKKLEELVTKLVRIPIE